MFIMWRDPMRITHTHIVLIRFLAETDLEGGGRKKKRADKIKKEKTE